MESFVPRTQTSVSAVYNVYNTRKRRGHVYLLIWVVFGSWRSRSWNIYTVYSEFYHATLTDTKTLPDPVFFCCFITSFIFNTIVCSWRSLTTHWRTCLRTRQSSSINFVKLLFPRLKTLKNLSNGLNFIHIKRNSCKLVSNFQKVTIFSSSGRRPV